MKILHGKVIISFYYCITCLFIGRGGGVTNKTLFMPQLSLKIHPAHIVGVLTFIIRINTTYECFKARDLFFCILAYEQLKFHAQLSMIKVLLPRGLFVCLFQEAISLIEPMTNDPVNYVRQGALIASAMILVQHNEVTCPRVRI